MATVWKAGSTEYFVIGTSRDLPAISDWEIKFVDLSNGNVTDETANVTIAEVVHTIAVPATSLTVGAANAGAKTITVTATEGSKFTKGMKLQIGTSSYVTVKAVTGDVLTLSAPLSATVASGSTITQSGKTGDYRIVVPTASTTMTLAVGGNYQVQVKSNAAEIDITSEIFDVADFDINQDIKAEFDYLKSVVDNLAGGSSVTAKLYM